MQVYRGHGHRHRDADATSSAGEWPTTCSTSGTRRTPSRVAEFQAQARAAIGGIRSRGGVPIVVGGSGLYVSAVLDDLRFPGTDPEVRARWEAELSAVGPERLHARLAEVDPAAAEAILPTNGRRIVRALEVIEITGEPFVATLPEPTEVLPAVRVGLEIPRDELDARIEQRVDRMWDQGFVDEVRLLAAQGLAGTPTASRALGYQQVLALLAGDVTGGAGAAGDGRCDAPVRPEAAALVPPGPADHVDPLRQPDRRRRGPRRVGGRHRDVVLRPEHQRLQGPRQPGQHGERPRGAVGGGLRRVRAK